ncbi:MAG: sulfatase-like hydrolase/transferase [Acidobacteria bacterium]|nr:sulfatase-like hydrolase/transferase [Acidobacteriota bacterium]
MRRRWWQAATVLSLLVGAGTLLSQRSQPNLLLITLDTVRADRIGAYGYKAAATPVLDRLAREGVRFVDATTQSPLTGPAHAALLTGVYPGRFGLRDNATTPLPDTASTLAELLHPSGYRTGGFIGAFILDRAYGFGQGFDEFDAAFERFEANAKLQAQRRGDRVVAAATRWLAARQPDERFFAWVHLYDAHTPYAAPPPFGARFRTRPYDGEIAYVDLLVGRLIDTLTARGWLERTIIVIVADHGESLGEHGEDEHGFFLYDSVLRVPWIMRLPGRERAGTVISDQVRAIDVVPTVLELLQVKTASRFDGESVLPLISGQRRVETPPSFAETYYPRLHFAWSELKAVRVGDWKYIEAPRPELYDLRRDPEERKNAADAHASLAAGLAAELRKGDGGFAAAEPAATQPDRETVERLRSLGYVGLVTTPPAGVRGPDPKDQIATLTAFGRLIVQALDHLRARQTDAAIATLKQALMINARAYDPHLLLGDAYLTRRAYDAALGEYAAAALINPNDATPVIGSASALAAQMRLNEALAKLQDAAILEPLSAEIPLARGKVYEMMDRDGEALEQFQRAVRLNPADPRPRARLADAALRLQKLDVAESEFRALLAMSYQPARSHYGLGRVAEAKGDRERAIAEYRRALALDPKLSVARQALAALK